MQRGIDNSDQDLQNSLQDLYTQIKQWKGKEYLAKAHELIFQENKERSTTTTICYDIIHAWKKAGELQKLWPTAKTMLMTSNRSYGLFEHVDWWKFPDEERITTNIQQKDSTRTVSLIFPGPTYEQGDLITWLAIDNGESTWQSIDINAPEVKWKWILSIQNGLLHFSHTDEMTQDDIDKLIIDDRDLCTLPSIKRPGKNINSSLLEKIWGVSKNRRFLVQMQDWSSGVLTLYNRTAPQVENILSDAKFSRVLYCDGVGNTWQMDGWRKEKGTSKKLVYEHHTKWISGEEVKWNMPAIFVIYNQPN
jgi:hypothetical protein